MKPTDTLDAHGNPYPHPRLRERLHFFPEIGLTIYDSHITIGAIKSRFLKDFGCESYFKTLPSSYILLLMTRIWGYGVHFDPNVYDRSYVPIRMKAKCDNEDTFTERAGIDITRARFNERLDRAYISVMREYRKDLQQMLKLADQAINDEPWRNYISKDKHLIFELTTSKNGNDVVKVKSKGKPKLRTFYIDKYIGKYTSLNDVENHFWDLMRRIFDRCGNKMWVANLDSDFVKFSGKSVCLKEDTFDPKVGKENAFNSAFGKYHRTMVKLFTGFKSAIEKELNRVDKILEKNLKI